MQSCGIQPGKELGGAFVALVEDQLAGERLAGVLLAFFTLRRAGQEHFGFDLDQPGGDYQESGYLIGSPHLQAVQVRQVLVGDLSQGQPGDIQLGALDQLQEQVEGTSKTEVATRYSGFVGWAGEATSSTLIREIIPDNSRPPCYTWEGALVCGAKI